MFIRVLSTLAVSGAMVAQAAVEFQVSPQGAAAGLGTADKPFRTLEQARDAVRELKQAGALPTGGVRVTLRPGTYELSRPFELTAADSGTAAAPVVYRAAERGTAILSGGVTLATWKQVTDPVVLKLIDAKAQGKVVWTELPPALLDPLPGFANGGCGFKGKIEYPLGLYQDNERLPVSRWPNEGFVMTGECLGASESAGHMGIRYTEGRFRFKNERLARWTGEPELWFNGLWFVPWADSKMRLKAIDPKEQSIALDQPADAGFGYLPDRHFYAFNAIGEIDTPGEWAVDRAQRRLYLWPAAELATHPVSVSVRENLVQADKVEHVRFEDLVLENCRTTAVVLRNSQAVTFSGSTLRHTGSWGVDLDGGSDCSVVGCDLYDLGEGGVKANGGIRNTLTPGNHLIENNHIHHFGRVVACYRPGATVSGVGNKIRHNLIHHAQHMAVGFSGNDHLIENNIVHDVCLFSSDAGALYACTRDWSQRGTVIRNNLFHALGKGVDGCGCRAIYLDDMTSGTTVESNIVTLSDHGVNLGGGKDNRVASNIALNCKESFTLHSRGIDSFAKVDAAKGRDSGCFKRLLAEEALFRAEPWRSRYPSLLAPLDLEPVDAQNAHGNTFTNNLNVGGGKLSVSNADKVMRTSTIETNLNLYEDPGFADLAGFDLRLREAAPIPPRLPDFKAPDFAQMGLYADARRASAPVKFGAGVTPMPVIQPRLPRPELKPRYILETLDGAAFKADGVADEREWPKSGKVPLECVNKIYQAPSKLPCTARIGFDGARLLLLVTVEVDPEKPLKSEPKWGGSDGLELAFREPSDPEAPIFLLHLFPDGTLVCPDQYGTAPAQVAALQKAVVYAAKSEKGRWFAEIAIPVAALGIKPESFRQVRFNLNVRRTCDNSWTCWWTPEQGIGDLDSSGLLVLPRVVPETPEMRDRRAAAQALFAAATGGDLKARELERNWLLRFDPDQVGVKAGWQAVGLKLDGWEAAAVNRGAAPMNAFGARSGWAWCRQTVTVNADELAQPFCALLFLCVDEEGEVYLNGNRVAEHSAKATGTPPGQLWREPFLVDLKRAGVAAGAVEVAVRLRGNLGTGGIRKGVFLVCGKQAWEARACYDYLTASETSPQWNRVPAFWQDFERERIPALPPVPDEAEFGKRLQRTMDLLASSTAEKRNRVRIFFYGQSITQGMHCQEMVNVLRSRFPWAVIDFENKSIGGFGAPALVRTGVHDLYPRDADLLIFHVYGDAASLDTLFANVRKRTSSDILVHTHHFTWVSDPEKLQESQAGLAKSVAEWYVLAEKYQMELAPVFRDWGVYLQAHDLGLNELMGDTVHGNVHHNPAGHTLLADLVLRNFRHHPGNPATYPDAVRTVKVTDVAVQALGAWQTEPAGRRTSTKGATLKLSFSGNRVDVLPLPCANPGTARILVDGKAPAEFPELYTSSLPSEGPYIWMPAIRRVTLGAGLLPRLEEWTLTPFAVDIGKGTLSYRLAGSVTGPDGEGTQAADFTSASGRISFEKGDLNIIWPCIYRKKDSLPDGYKVTWQVLPLFVDPWRPAANAEAQIASPVTLVKGLANGPHTLEISANGDGEIPIEAFVVRQPPLKD
jgi:parallel beta-helix repeat protein